MEFVAHRAGNTAESLRAAEGKADLIEMDVHHGRAGEGEVRHAKRLWPTRRLWERWYLIPGDTAVLTLDELLAMVQPDTGLWLDLKGVCSSLGSSVESLVKDGRPVVLSSKSWWLLGAYAATEGVRTFRSAGNRWELGLLLWLPSRVRTDGAVVHRRLLSDRVIRRLLQRGLLFSWNIPDQATIDHLERRGVDGVIVDDLSLLERQLS